MSNGRRVASLHFSNPHLTSKVGDLLIVSILKRMYHWIKSTSKGEFLKLLCVDSPALRGGWILIVMTILKGDNISLYV